MSSRIRYELEVDETFSAPELDRRLWIPHYLPQWSTRAASAARYSVGDGLKLRIDPDQAPWYPEGDRFTKVSSLQTGIFAGPPGSIVGQHRFRDALIVREAQENADLYTPRYGLFECRARAIADPANMVALWMIGYEDRPERSAEICVFEIFGRDVAAAECRIGMGVKAWSDPELADDFTRETVSIDARQSHDYAVEWTPESVSFFVDDGLVKVVDQSPAYPMQVMLSVFEFADGPELPSPPDSYPKVFEVDWFRGWRRAT